MSVTKQEFNKSVRKVTWYPQYQETSLVVTHVPDKTLGIVKKIKGLPVTGILQKVSEIEMMYPETNNGNIPYDRGWICIDPYQANSFKTTVTGGANTYLASGQTLNVTVSGQPVVTTDVPSYVTFLQVGQPYWLPSGVSSVATIPNNGTVNFQIYNGTGSTVDLLNVQMQVKIFRSANEVGASMYNYGVRKGTGFFSQVNEGGMPYREVEKSMKVLFEIMKANDPTVRFPDDTEIYSDYFETLEGYNNFLLMQGDSGIVPTDSQLHARFASESNARGTCNYYSQACYEYRNRFIIGYLNFAYRVLDAIFLLNTIASCELEYVAMPTRKAAIFAWGALDGSGQPSAEVTGTYWSLPTTAPDGELLRLNFLSATFEHHVYQTFIGLMLTQGIYFWNDAGQLGTDTKCWEQSNFGGYVDWKTRFKPTGGTPSTWTGAAGQPQQVCVTDQAKWANSPWNVDNAAFAAYELYTRVAGRASTKIRYATFSYTDEAGSHSGYISGNTPMLGSKGDASASVYGNANYGQSNIVNIKTGKKPVVWECNGPDGYMIVVMPLFHQLDENITFTVTTSTLGTQTINHVGNQLGVYLIS